MEVVYEVLFSVDNLFNKLKSYHGIASPRQDICRVMDALGISYKTFIHTNKGLTSIYYGVKYNDYSYIRKQLIVDYDADILQLSDYRYLIHHISGDAYCKGEVFYSKDYQDVKGLEHFWNKSSGYYIGVREAVWDTL